MSSLSSLYIKAETLEILLKTIKKKGEKGIELTIAMNDETNDYGQNVSSFVAQSKEDREAKKSKYYVGNGKCFWTNGKIEVATKKEEVSKIEDAKVIDEQEDDLPF